ncbi:hypothetical protein ACRRTK_001364 [Alexandromys fortis]
MGIGPILHADGLCSENLVSAIYIALPLEPPVQGVAKRLGFTSLLPDNSCMNHNISAV